MRSRHRHASARSATLSLKPWVTGLGFLVLMVFSLMLITLNRNDSPMITQIRTSITDGLLPVIDVLSSPVHYLGQFNTWLDHTLFLYEQNERLRQENKQLMQWQTIAQQLQYENAELHQLLDLKAPPQLSFVTTRIVGGIDHLYSKSALLDAGSRDGVHQHRAVLTHEGLVGRVSDVGNQSSSVLLITDINSRIPVMTSGTHTKAILSGNNSMHPTLRFLPENSSITVGEQIVTTSDGNILPAGLPIGEVTEIIGNEVRISPYVDFSKLEFVRIAHPASAE